MKVATDSLDPAKPHDILSLYQVTPDGMVTCDVAFPCSNAIQNVCTQGSNLLISLCDAKLPEAALIGTATVLNALFEKHNGRETMAALCARLKKEAEISSSSSPSGPKKDDDEKDAKQERNKVRKEWRPLTNKEARNLAEKMGFREKKNPPFDSHNELVFYHDKKKIWITPDIDGHNGGVWKLFKHNRRDGTYNMDLTMKICD